MTYTPSEIAKRYRVGIRKVHTWIQSGELVAVDVASKRGLRPQWRISQEAIDRFERIRGVDAKPKAAKRMKLPEGFIEYF